MVRRVIQPGVGPLLPKAVDAALPAVRVDGTAYVVDLGRRQFRDTFNVNGRIDFDSVEGQRLCAATGVVTCLRCGMSVIVPMSDEDDEWRCMRCGRTVGGPFPNH